jgi:UDP-N-acetylmuramoyl-L-alanyl-D-glutamate--2,6-diaminopimelate ligase
MSSSASGEGRRRQDDRCRPVPVGRLVALARLPLVDIKGSAERVVTGISTSSRTIKRNEMFVALMGTRTDSHRFIPEAVERGAAAVVVHRDVPEFPGVTMVRVDDTRRALGPLAQAFHGNPAMAMDVVGVTGTNGKTTVTHIIQSVLNHAQRRCGLIGTLGSRWGNVAFENGMTTPDPQTIAWTMSEMSNAGMKAVAMEVSSHALDQERVTGIPFKVGVLTNVSQDHLDYHGDFPTYIGVKRRLFFNHVGTTPGGVACLNVDDPVGEELADSFHGPKILYSVHEAANADVRVAAARCLPHRTEVEMEIAGEWVEFSSHLTGPFNVQNLAAAASACLALGLDATAIGEGLSEALPIRGRFERVDVGQPFEVVIDYSHTPDALEKALRAARQITTGRVICVFGCGGDRDKSKRAPMGEAAARLADYVVLTSDNPRFEEPQAIADMAVEGIESTGAKKSSYTVILDRRLAIDRALHVAGAGDVVVIAGKGHETYQEVRGARSSFDDRAVARALLGGMFRAPGVSPEVVSLPIEEWRI